MIEQRQKFLDLVEQDIFERLSAAESFEPYRSMKERRYKYYRIYVKNFVVYYVVIDNEGPEKIMEVRKFLYNKQNTKKLLWLLRRVSIAGTLYFYLWL